MNVDIFEKQQFTLQFLYSLLQVYIVHRVSFIFHLNVLQCPFVQEDAVICFADRGEGEQEQGIGNRFSFHEFYNFLLFNFLIFFLKTFFLPTTIAHTHTHDPRPLPTTHDIQLHSHVLRFEQQACRTGNLTESHATVGKSTAGAIASKGKGMGNI